MKLSFLFMALSFFSGLTWASCESDLIRKTAKPAQVVEGDFMNPATGRTMHYKYTLPTVRGAQTRAMLHGLGDDMTKVEALAQEAEKLGQGVLQVDEHGHGKTLTSYLQTHDGNLPEEFAWDDNVNDIMALIYSLGIKRLSLVGHSYGGGVVFGLAAKLEAENKVKLTSIHMLAPYVQSIDKFMTDYLQSPQLVIDEYSKWLSMGLPDAFVGQMMIPLTRTVTAMTAGIDYARSLTRRVLRLDQALDRLMTPVLQQFMQKAYKTYFVMMSGKKETDLTEAELALIDTKVEACIKATIGIRTLDLLDTSIALPKIKAPIQVIGAIDDKLVVPPQLEAFARRLSAAMFVYDLNWIDGKDANHLFPQKRATTAFALIEQFSNRIKPDGTLKPAP